MSENTDVLKRGYDAFVQGDIETVSALFSDDAVWEGPATEGVPMSGKAEGKDAVLQALGHIGELYESFNVSPDEMIEQDGTVVILSTVQLKMKSGTEITTPGVEAWEMSDGKVHRVRSWIDTALLK